MAQQKLDLNREDEKVSVGEDAYEEKLKLLMSDIQASAAMKQSEDF